MLRIPSKMVVFTACILVTGCVEPLERPTGDITIGVLLPFTGNLAASGSNLERAVIMAAEAINATSGSNRASIRIVTADTHSGTERGIESAEKLLNIDQVEALIGPENADIIKEMVPLVREVDIVQLLPGVTSPQLAENDGEEELRWFRLAPSIDMVGCTMASRMFADGMRTVAVLCETDSYSIKLADELSETFESLGGRVVLSRSVPQSGLVSEVVSLEPDAIALLAFPLTAASVLRDWAAVGKKVQWYFSPVVNTDAFLLNVPPGVADGAIGVSPAIPFRSVADFDNKFRIRWSGEAPFDTAYFYYDALAILALAMESANLSGTDKAVYSHLLKVSRPPGVIVDWDELNKGFELLSQGSPINYRGASGALDFKDDGDINSGLLQFWNIRDHIIHPTSLSSFTECLQ